MTSRILIADDSLTIQKVISITLANSGHELVECLNEVDLLKKIQSNHFDLILLDFNLSDSHSGYELSKKINHFLPSASIVVMLGTFDTIDDSLFEECGIADKIVKPFESTKLIKKCRDLLDGIRPNIQINNGTLENNEAETAIENYNNSDNIDLWKVNAPQVLHADIGPSEELLIENDANEMNLDPLSSEIEGWGFAAGNTLEEKFQKSFPPIIEDESDLRIDDKLKESSKFANDIDFELDGELEDLDTTNPIYEIPQELNRDLLSEISEDGLDEDFWAVDEVSPKKLNPEAIKHIQKNEITADLSKPLLEFQKNENEKENRQTNLNINQEELVEKLKNAMKPMIEEMVKEFCRESAEKVAWEIIPDLAENLIRKEIKEISESL